jgi:hypothetical protein
MIVITSILIETFDEYIPNWISDKAISLCVFYLKMLNDKITCFCYLDNHIISFINHLKILSSF